MHETSLYYYNDDYYSKFTIVGRFAKTMQKIILTLVSIFDSFTRFDDFKVEYKMYIGYCMLRLFDPNYYYKKYHIVFIN